MVDPESDSIRGLALRARESCRGTDLAPLAEAAIERLDGPLRVAIAGRTKAGKSTLLNALVGDRLAPTDASECTRIVTWYRHGIGYAVRAYLPAGGQQELPFRRSDGTLDVSLDGTSPGEVERLEVEWPSRRLADLTLIDTPGLSSADPETSGRTMAALLGFKVGDPAGGNGDVGLDLVSDGWSRTADAVIYLLRHVHRRDADFLEAFLDRSISYGSPVNSIAVLSRADELGAGRVDALESAARIAKRYAADERLATLTSGVVPVCGLLAETALTLREEEAAWIREIATLGQEDQDEWLLSVDRFRMREVDRVPRPARDRLLGRFGLFGLRHAVALRRAGDWSTATELARLLERASGIGELQRLLTERFAGRSRALKARSTLAILRSLAAALTVREAQGAGQLAAEVERAEAGSMDLTMLRLLHLAISRTAALNEVERTEVERLAASDSVAAQLGLAEEASHGEVRDAALAGVERWRTRAASPFADRRTIEAADIAARAYEALYTVATAGGTRLPSDIHRPSTA